VNEIDVVKTIFGFYVVGDWKGAEALIHPEAEVFFPGDPAILPWAGALKGSGIKKFFDAVKDELDFLEYTISAFHHVGPVVVMQATERCRVRRTGRLVTNDHMGIARVQDGLMVSYREYADTAALHAGFSG
jgi:ketosteroid isomerase-like protein